MHTVTCKLNNDARLYAGQNGTTFFVGLGEKHYNYKTKQSGYTNYDAAIFAKDSQVQYMTDNLKAGAIVSVSGSSIIIENDEKYGSKLVLQDAKLAYVFNPATPMPDNVRQGYQQAPQQQAPAPQPQSAPNAADWSEDIPFAPIGLAQDNCFIYCI